MKRALKIVIGICVVLLLAIGAVFGSAFAGNSKIVDGAVIAPGVTVMQDGFVSAFALDTGDGHVALVDAGKDHAAAAIIASLRRHGIAPDAVSAIFLTHGHGDHTAGTTHFPNAQVYALRDEVPLVEGRTAGHSPIAFLAGAHPTGITVTHPLNDGETVHVGTLTVRVFAVPGHTAGSAAYLARGVLFLGDSAGANSSGALKPAPWAFSDDQHQNIASLKALSARLSQEGETVNVLAPAHTGTLPGLAPLQAFAAAH